MFLHPSALLKQKIDCNRYHREQNYRTKYKPKIINSTELSFAMDIAFSIFPKIKIIIRFQPKKFQHIRVTNNIFRFLRRL